MMVQLWLQLCEYGLPLLTVMLFLNVCLFLSLGGGGLVYGYGDDDLNRSEVVDIHQSGDEDSRDSNSVSSSVQDSPLGHDIFHVSPLLPVLLNSLARESCK